MGDNFFTHGIIEHMKYHKVYIDDIDFENYTIYISTPAIIIGFQKERITPEKYAKMLKTMITTFLAFPKETTKIKYRARKE